MLKSLAVSVLAACMAAPAFASGLVATQTVERMIETVSAAGDTVVTFEEATLVIPGEALVYKLNFENTGPDAADNVVLTVPVPDSVTFTDGSATNDGAPATFSVDGGDTFTNRSELMVTSGDAVRPAMAEDITHVRWTFDGPIPAGVAGSLAFSGVLN